MPTGMITSFIYSLPLAVLFLACAAVFCLALFAGYAAGKKLTAPYNEGLFQLIPTSLLGLLALLLGFTFSMAVNRFDNRKTAVLQEANAIGTAWLRAGLLQRDDDIKHARRVLRSYLENRIQFPTWVEAADVVTRFNERNFELQNELWHIVEEARRTDRSPLTASFATSLNEVFDRGSDRWFHRGDHVPTITYIVISLIASASLFSLGLLYGHRRLHRRAPIALALLLSLVLILVNDLDRPSRGFAQVDVSILNELLTSFDRNVPH